ncbi:MAG: hypothetical protein ACRDJ9_33255 [Dehalococcoidia bacterium]
MIPESAEAVSRPTPRRAEPPRYEPFAPGQVQMGLQRRAPSTLRRHLARAAGRMLVLLIADLAAFALLREAYRAVGQGGAGRTSLLMPGRLL